MKTFWRHFHKIVALDQTSRDAAFPLAGTFVFGGFENTEVGEVIGRFLITSLTDLHGQTAFDL